MPAPKYTEEQQGYYTAVAGGLVSSVSKILDADELRNVSVILEALAYESRKNILPLYRETVLKSKNAWDMESSQVIDVIWDGMVFDAGILNFQKARTAYFEGPLHTMNDTLASTTATIKSEMEASIQTVIDQLSK